MLTLDWKNIRHTLEPLIRKKRDGRIAQNHQRQVSSRKGIVENLYDDFKKSSTGAGVFPRPHAVFQFPGFKELINDVSDLELEPKDFSEVMKELPGFLAEWELKKKDSLIACLPSIPTADDMVANQNNRHLLATCIFRCDNSRCVGHSKAFSFHQATLHECKHRYPDSVVNETTELVYSERGSAAAASVVAALGFNVQKTVPAQLDALQIGVGCVHCMNSKNKQTQVVGWLQFV
jgi:hypothetical protein